MPTLRIIQQPGSGPNRHQIAVNAEIPGFQPLSFSREIEFALSPQDGEKIRWYLEDYLQFAQDPAPQIAARSNGSWPSAGRRSSHDLRRARRRRAALDVDAAASPLDADRDRHRHRGSHRHPLGVDPQSSYPHQSCSLGPGVCARAMGRANRLAPSRIADKVRILLAICRPGAEDDVPFRSVASRLVKGLSDRTAKPSSSTFCGLRPTSSSRKS